MLVFPDGYAREHAHGFSLASGGDNDDLMVLKPAQVVQGDPGIGGDMQIPQVEGYLCVPHDASPAQDDLPAIEDGHVDGLLNAMNIGREGGEYDPAPGLAENVLERAAYFLLRKCESSFFGVGAVRQK